MSKDAHYKLRFCGSGGQGLMLLGDIVARTAGLADNYKVLLTKSYGPEARGTACRSELIITDKVLFELSVESPDLMVALSQSALNKYCHDLVQNSLLLIDRGLKPMLGRSEAATVEIPFTDISKNSTGSASQTNMAALGAVAFFMPVLDRLSVPLILREYIQERRLSQDCIRAYEAGYEYACNCKQFRL